MYIRFLILIVGMFPLLSVSALSLPAKKDAACIQVIQPAKNSTTGECQSFSTPCDVPEGWTPVRECELETTKYIEPKFEVKKFASCTELQDTMVDIFSRYQDRYWYPYGGGRGWFGLDIGTTSVGVMEDRVAPTSVAVEKSVSNDAGSLGGQSQGSTDPFSTTNTQVAGVDEADIVKTDGINIYTYSQITQSIRIVRMSDMKLLKVLKLPDTFSSIELYLSQNKLTLVGQKYTNQGSFFTFRYYAPETKTIVAVYDITTPETPRLERYNQLDGSYRESRLIGSTLYLLSSNTLRMPPVYLTRTTDDAGYDEAIKKLRSDFALKYVVPQVRETRESGTSGKYIQSIRSSVANCSDITFVLPDEETMKHIDFSPAFVSLSSIDILSPTAKMRTELLFGDVSQIHMSKSSLYITSTISQSTISDKSSSWGYGYESSTLIHRYSLEKGSVKYQYTTRVSGNPMTQYSMDEDAAGNFRIVTQLYAWSSGVNENSTRLSVINPTGKVIGTLSDIAPGENFQSSRFIGDRLYLVTFEQIDPFFVIDLSIPTQPKILGELKIPGYSTYLHPYDADRLIGIGYDTGENRWGGVQNAGLKIDLYNVRDVKNPKQEATFTLGDQGSSSEVLTNPRAFVWYKEKNLLLLPAQIQYSANDPVDTYRARSIYQGLFGISILPGSISEKFRVTHIAPTPDLEKEWKESCAPYLGKSNTTRTCRKLLDGSEYCTNEYNYVPQYCFADSTVESYMAANIWRYNSDFITRSLYRGESFYTLSESSIRSWSFSGTTTPKQTIEFPTSLDIYPIAKPLLR